MMTKAESRWWYGRWSGQAATDSSQLAALHHRPQPGRQCCIIEEKIGKSTKNCLWRLVVEKAMQLDFLFNLGCINKECVCGAP